MTAGTTRRASARVKGGGAEVAIPEEDTLAPLKDVMAPQAFRELVELYELTIKGALAGIADAASRGALPALRGHAHDLAGMCGQTGCGGADCTYTFRGSFVSLWAPVYATAYGLCEKPGGCSYSSRPIRDSFGNRRSLRLVRGDRKAKRGHDGAVWRREVEPVGHALDGRKEGGPSVVRGRDDRRLCRRRKRAPQRRAGVGKDEDRKERSGAARPLHGPRATAHPAPRPRHPCPPLFNVSPWRGREAFPRQRLAVPRPQGLGRRGGLILARGCARMVISALPLPGAFAPHPWPGLLEGAPLPLPLALAPEEPGEREIEQEPRGKPEGPCKVRESRGRRVGGPPDGVAPHGRPFRAPAHDHEIAARVGRGDVRPEEVLRRGAPQGERA